MTDLRPMRLLSTSTFVILLSCTLTARAQSDTLAVRLAKKKEPVARVNELVELGRLLRAKAPQKSDSLLLLALKEGRGLKDQAVYSNALSTLGNSLNERGEVDSASVLFGAAEAISSKADDPRGVAVALTGMGNNRIYRGDMPGAMDFFLRAIRVAEQTGDSSYMAASLSNIGWTYYNNGQLIDAETFTLRSLSIYNARKDSTGMAQSYNNLGIFLAEKGEFDSSLVLMQRSLDLRIRLNILKDIPWNHSNLGGLLIMMGRPAEGLVQLAKAAEAFERIGQMRGAVSALIASERFGSDFKLRI